MALRHGSPFEAYYYLANIHSSQLQYMPPHMRSGSCSIAVSFYKIVAERGTWEEDLLGDAEALPFKDNSMDAYTIAFGLRNVTNIPKALSEAHRVIFYPFMHASV